MYSKMETLPNTFATIKDNKLIDPFSDLAENGRLILKNGTVVDPKNNIEEVKDIVIYGGVIQEIGSDLVSEEGDKVINCEGELVVPGLVDMHLHLGDLFEISTDPIFTAISDGVTMGLSPGAGNTLMAPALVGAEIDRGVPINMGLYLGAPSVLGTLLTLEETIKLFKGELSAETMGNKMTRNSITNTTASLVIGLKDHMGHFIMSDENYDKIFEITSKAELVYMSHTQDPEHAVRLVEISKGRPIHLAHSTASGCGTHGDPYESMQTVLELCKQGHVSTEFVTSHLRKGGGSKDGLIMPEESKKLAYDALESGIVDVLISDGQHQATMKGFGDTKDNIPAMLELVEMGVLSLSESIATMTANPARLIGKRTGNDWWTTKIGHLGKSALANVTIINRKDKEARYTIVNGEIVAFEGRPVRRGSGAGGYISKFGMVKRTGVGELPLISYMD